MKKNYKAHNSTKCFFCLIVKKQLDAAVIFEDKISLAFLDHRPLFPGHCLLIPKDHYKNFYDLPQKLLKPFFTNAQKLAKTIQQVMK